MTAYSNSCCDMLLGLSIGDALGVPVEFKSRNYLKENPISKMIGFGTHSVPSGTWSDDSALSFCLAEALIESFSIEHLGQKFVKWYHENHWTASGNVFDIGYTTLKGIVKIKNGISAYSSGEISIKSNGNGSLMRIAPLIFYLQNKSAEERFQIVRQVSSITHAHKTSVIACFYYTEFAMKLLQGIDKIKAYDELKVFVPTFLKTIGISDVELLQFNRLLVSNIFMESETNINTNGFVIHTLEAAIWCILKTKDFKSAVLKAVNLGDDTDTVGSVTGALAGLIYGRHNVPKDWLDVLKRKDDIEKLANQLSMKYEY